VDKKKVERALKLYESKDYSVTEITELTGVLKATLYRRLKDSVLKAPTYHSKAVERSYRYSLR
jgi:predicted DNA-binding protein YlxM (UPF0122 family)